MLRSLPAVHSAHATYDVLIAGRSRFVQTCTTFVRDVRFCTKSSYVVETRKLQWKLYSVSLAKQIVRTQNVCLILICMHEYVPIERLGHDMSNIHAGIKQTFFWLFFRMLTITTMKQVTVYPLYHC